VLVELLDREQRRGRGADSGFVFVTRSGLPVRQRNAARAVAAAGEAAGLGKVSPHDLRRSPDRPLLATWTTHYAQSFAKAQRDEARERLLLSGFDADIALTQDGPEGLPSDQDDGKPLLIEERTTGIEPATLGLGIPSRRSNPSRHRMVPFGISG
jgi:hypothetical protein